MVDFSSSVEIRGRGVGWLIFAERPSGRGRGGRVARRYRVQGTIQDVVGDSMIVSYDMI